MTGSGIADEEAPPVFAEPWQAQAFATSVQLSRRGIFSWADWVSVFSAEIARHPQRADEESDTAYYRQWLAALETILAERGVLNPAEIAETQEHWRRSYLHTPHGQPIEFRRDLHDASEGAAEGGDHDHHHAQDRAQSSAPIAVSPARPA